MIITIMIWCRPIDTEFQPNDVAVVRSLARLAVTAVPRAVWWTRKVYAVGVK